MESLRLIRKYKPQVIWSTFPVATAHLIGLTVHRLTGLPWIADFRDPMIQENAPSSPLIRAVYRNLEANAVAYASCCVMVTKAAREDYAKRYPGKHDRFWQVVENGYDESLFEAHPVLDQTKNENFSGRPFRIVHSGFLYTEGRNPKPFLLALKSFIPMSKINLEVVFRGCGNEPQIQKWITDLGLDNFVKICPPVSYNAAIQEMLQADALALFQGALFQKQIPAKVYEYIRAGRPILALTDETGETAKFLRNWDRVYFGDMESPANITLALSRLLSDFRLKKKPMRKPAAVMALSRRSKTIQLVDILNSTIKKRLE